MLDPRDMTPGAFQARAAALGAHDLSIRRLLSAVVGRGIHDRAAWGAFPGPASAAEAIVDPLPRLTSSDLDTSPVDGFQKLLFRTADGLAVETVLIPLHKPGAVSVCLSSQVGCAMGCVFCATARMPSAANLETWEIDRPGRPGARAWSVAQGRRVTGAVFMGMGEPFLNYDRVMAAAELLRCPYGAAIGAPAITISTVGLVPEIDRFTAERGRSGCRSAWGPRPTRSGRELVPIAGRTPVAEVMAAARRHALDRRDAGHAVVRLHLGGQCRPRTTPARWAT